MNSYYLLRTNIVKTDTKEESIFNTIQTFFQEKEIPICNILSSTTDGAPAMTGCQGFLSAFEKNSIKCTRWTLYFSSSSFGWQKF